MGRSRTLVRKTARSILAGALVFAALAGCARQRPTFPQGPYGLGHPGAPDVLARLDIDVSPDGRGLPDGRGTADNGAGIFSAACSRCHGATIALGPNRWPYATTLFDYIRRAMPPGRARPLTADQVYAVTAYVLATNGFSARGDVINKETLSHVVTQDRSEFVEGR
jgi:S-disulfanyl-L-cysteine oxidoreductase SoxD